MTILYLKNTPVFDVDTKEILDFKKCPGLLQKNPSAFKQWMKYRYSSNTNSFARALKGVTFGQGNRVKIDRETHAFSLSDCYWISDDPSLRFEELSPYFANFWKGDTEYSGGAVPTLYANGYISKYWESATNLVKTGDLEIEVECSRVAKDCGVNCAKVWGRDCDIVVQNFTTPGMMLESAEMSGLIDPDDFDEFTIVSLLGKQGLQMVILDAIFGNGDRHAGNFGFLRSADTGEYLGVAPLYDFDHALDAKGVWDPLLQGALDVATDPQWIAEAKRLCIEVQKSTENNIFMCRARELQRRLEEPVGFAKSMSFSK